jgi:hypothetical protein
MVLACEACSHAVILRRALWPRRMTSSPTSTPGMPVMSMVVRSMATLPMMAA